MSEATHLGVRCSCVHVKDCYPSEAILETVKLRHCDLIVMASHGRRGSVAAEVLAHSSVLVLIVR